jgi:uncharacterized membrane protein (DUF485 family)
MKKIILTWAGIMCICYLLIAFTLWQFNPAMWEKVERGLLSVIGTLFSGVLTGVYYDFKNETTPETNEPN